jgi:hypothetical protein
MVPVNNPPEGKSPAYAGLGINEFIMDAPANLNVRRMPSPTPQLELFCFPRLLDPLPQIMTIFGQISNHMNEIYRPSSSYSYPEQVHSRQRCDGCLISSKKKSDVVLADFIMD